MKSNKIDYRIYGTHSRDEMISEEVKALEGNCKVYYDDGDSSKDPIQRCLHTCKKSFTDKWEDDVTHICALQDDVLLCNGFTNIMEQIVSTHPDKIICLFPFDHLKRNTYTDNLVTPYIRVTINSNVGTIIPVQYINECFEYVSKKIKHVPSESLCMKYYADSHGIEIITTIPSTVQHIGDSSILFPNAKIRRTPYFDMNPKADWSCTEIANSLILHESIFNKKKK